MIIRISQPLPECLLCQAPTKRQTHIDNNGLCGGCADGIADTVRMLPVRDNGAARELGPGGDVLDLEAHRGRLRPADDTAFVERWLPPVPGQLTLDDEP